MDIIAPLLIGIALAMDCFAVSLAIGARKPVHKAAVALIIGLFFGGFQFGMTLLGWGVGEAFMSLIERFGSLMAFVLLLVIGVRMIREGWEDEPLKVDVHVLQILPVTILALATSIDALAAGFSFAALNLQILFPSLIIGIISLLFSIVGVLMGKRLARILGRKAEVVGGLVLIGIGIRILIESFPG